MTAESLARISAKDMLKVAIGIDDKSRCIVSEPVLPFFSSIGIAPLPSGHGSFRESLR